MSTELINVYSNSIQNGFAPSRHCTLLNWSMRSDVANEQLFTRISNLGCPINVLFKMRNYSKFFIIGIHHKFERFIVGSMDRESSQQLQMWFSEHFFAPKLAV